MLAAGAMERRAPHGVELACEIAGSGDALVLIHAGVCADFFAPLSREPAVGGRFRVLRYHRPGYGESPGLDGPLTMADHAAHCAGLMEELELGPAHVAGHSSSAMMALQLALDRPELVASLTLLDSARPAPATDVQAAFVREVAGPAIERHRAGDNEGAIDLWMQGVCGPEYRDPLERAIPGAVAQAMEDADSFLGQELPAVMQWEFSADHAARVNQPVMVVVGEDSHPVFHERAELLLGWLPNAEAFTLPAATHLLHVERPREMAEALTAFADRHPPATGC
jgi:pimeloyl-ACP methyl ester carboxylesterase